MQRSSLLSIILPLNLTMVTLLIGGMYAYDTSKTANACFNDAFMYTSFKPDKAFNYIIFCSRKPLEDYFNALSVYSLGELMS